MCLRPDLRSQRALQPQQEKMTVPFGSKPMQMKAHPATGITVRAEKGGEIRSGRRVSR